MIHRIYKKEHLILLFSLIIAFLCLWLRTSPPYYPGKYLWAEDGPIFIQQAWALGIHSLWTPYAGYLHLYIRLVSLFCHTFGFNLIWTSYIFLLGWLIAFLTLIAVIVVRAQSFKLPPFYIYWLVILITLQPSAGEIFFHLTNSQWPLGAALGIYLLTRNNIKPSLFELLFIILLGLSGPFSLFVAPLFLFKELIEKNLKDTYPLLITLFLCAIIQGTFFAFSNRNGLSTGHHDISVLLSPILHALFFNLDGSLSVKKILSYATIMFFFWIPVLLSFKRSLFSNNKLSIKISFVLLFSFAFICLIAGVIAIIEDISWHTVLPLRYIWIPTTVLFFSAAILSSHSKKMLACIFLSMSFICIVNFHKITSAKTDIINLQFKSYAHFSEYDRVTIPIGPELSSYNFSFSAGEKALPQSLLKLLPAQKPNLYSFSSHKIKTHISNKTIVAQTENSHSYFIFNEPLYCPKGSDIGVAIKLHRNKNGFATLWWGYNKKFKHKQSISYFSPEGDITLYFAFPNNKQANDIAFAPSNNIDTVEIKSLDVYCLL